MYFFLFVVSYRSCPLFQHVPDAVMKDNDFRGKAKIRLPPSVGDDLVKQLHTDCEFLANVYEVMDYSLLGSCSRRDSHSL